MAQTEVCLSFTDKKTHQNIDEWGIWTDIGLCYSLFLMARNIITSTVQSNWADWGDIIIDIVKRAIQGNSILIHESKVERNNQSVHIL